MSRYRVGKRDAMHADVEKILIAHGWETSDISAAGKGVPDIIAFKAGRGLHLIEVKSGKTADKQPNKTRDRQQDFARRFPVTKIVTLDQARAFAAYDY